MLSRQICCFCWVYYSPPPPPPLPVPLTDAFLAFHDDIAYGAAHKDAT